MKRLLSFCLALLVVFGLLPTAAKPVDAATTLKGSPNASVEYDYTTKTPVGTIRYISQISGSSHFHSDYWGKWKSQAGIECGTASVSMALSYVGINKTPKEILDAHNGQTWFSGWAGTKYLTPSISEGMDNYINGNGKYSPLIIHLPNYSKAGHYVILAGKISSNVYQVVDPADSSVWEITIDGKKATYKGKTDYIDSVSQYYNKDAEMEDGGHIKESFSSHCTIKLTKEAYVKSMPCSRETDPDSIDVEGTAAKKGSTYTAIGLVKNEHGNLWYKVIAANNKTGYIYAEYAEFVEALSTGVSISGVSAPTELKAGNSFSLKGEIKSQYLTMTKLFAGVVTTSGSSLVTGKQLDINTRSYSLLNSAADMAAKFGDLTAGEYMYRVAVGVKNYYAKSAKETSYKEETIVLHENKFKVVGDSSGYLAKCDLDETYLKVSVTKATTLKTLPCSSGTNANSANVRDSKVGEILTVTAMYKNTAGNYWYQVDDNGTTCYVFAGDTKVEEHLGTDITLTGVKAPTALDSGKVFVIEGEIRTVYNVLCTVQGYIFPGEVTKYSSAYTYSDIGDDSPWKKYYSLKGSKVDNGLEFNKLADGTYSYLIVVVVPNYYSTDGKNRSTYWLGQTIFAQTFTVGDTTCSHSYDSTVTPPTCTEEGYTTHICSKCGDAYVDSYVDPTGHSYGEWEYTVYPTCTEGGIQERCCHCGATETRATDAGGHEYDRKDIPPTCTEEGYTLFTCYFCDDSYVDGYVPANGHSYGDWYQTLAPTGTQPGQEQRDCLHCDHYETREVPPTGEIDPNAPQILIDSVTAAPGKTVDVAVSLKNNPGINTFTLSIHYDTSKLALTGVTASSALGGTFIFNDKTATVVWQSSSDTTYNGEVFTLHFAVLDGSEGDAAVTLSYKSGNICNYDEVDVDFAILAGGVSVLEYLPGDINGDGVVNNKDLNRLMKYLTDDTTEVNAAALDVNGDGAVNNKDLNRLMKHLTDNTVEIH